MMKKILISGLALALTACGFTPMHAPGGSAGLTAMKNVDVEIADTNDRADQEGAFWVQQHLQDRIGVSPQGAHILKLDTGVSLRALSITSDDVAKRFDLRNQVKYQLIDRKSGDVLDKGTVEATSTFGAPNDPYSTESARTETLRNVSREVADKLMIRLATYYSQNTP